MPALQFEIEIENVTKIGGTYTTYTATSSKFLSPDADRILSISGIRETYDARPTEVSVEISALNKSTQISELFFENHDSRLQRQITIKRNGATLFVGNITRSSLARSGESSLISISASNDMSFADNIVHRFRVSDYGYSASPDIIYWGYLEIQE